MALKNSIFTSTMIQAIKMGSTKIKSLFSVFLVFSFSIAAFGQNSSMLMRAMHCIKNGDRDWLSSPLSEQKKLRVGFTRDTVSYPGETHVIVVVYDGASNGQVFDLKEEKNGKRRLLTIENNGKFSIIGKGEVKFVDPPLGGVWTHQFLKSTITKIEHGPKTYLSVPKLIEERSDTACSSYAKH